MAYHVLVERADLVKRLHKVGCDVWADLVDRLANRTQFVGQPQGVDVVPRRRQRAGDVELGLPERVHDIDAPNVFGGHHVVVHQGEHTELLHNAIR